MDGRRMASQFACHGSVCIRGVAFGRGEYSRRRLLPFAPPTARPKAAPASWASWELRAFRLFKQRDTAMFWNRLSFSIPLMTYFMHTPQQLRFWVANKLQPS